MPPSRSCPETKAQLDEAVVSEVASSVKRADLVCNNNAMVTLPLFYAQVVLDLSRWDKALEEFEPTTARSFASTAAVRMFRRGSNERFEGVDQFEMVKNSLDQGVLENFLRTYPRSLYTPYIELKLKRQREMKRFSFGPRIVEGALVLPPKDRIKNLKCTELWEARNVLFYMRGYCFVSERARKHFRSDADCPKNCDSRKSINLLVKRSQTADELRYIQLIADREKANGCHKSRHTPAC